MLESNDSFHRRQLNWFLVTLGAIAVVIVGTRSHAVAQVDPSAKYDVIPIPESVDTRLPKDLDLTSDEGKAAKKASTDAKKKRTEVKQSVLQVLSGAAPMGEAFRIWFEQVIFAEMTQNDQESLLDMPKKRQEFFRYYVQKSRSNVHAELIQMTGVTMRKVVQGNYHPAVRYNAMVILGELNEQEGGFGGQPLPYVRILRPILLAEFVKPGQIEAVRVAALLGILRHAELDSQRPGIIPDADRNLVVDEMVKLLKSKDPPEERLAGHRWMQRIAIEILGSLRSTGKGGEVATELVRIINDDTLPITFRCTAAVAYGQLGFKREEVNVREAVGHLAALALFACEQELARLEDELKTLAERPKGPRRLVDETPKISSGGGVGGGARRRTITRGEAEFEEYRLNVSRTLLKHYIKCVQVGVGLDEKSGIRQHAQALAEKDPNKVYVDDVVKSLGDLMKATDKQRTRGKPDPDDEEEFTAEMLIDSVRGNLDKLDELVVATTPKKAGDTAKLPAAVGPGGVVAPPDAPTGP